MHIIIYVLFSFFFPLFLYTLCSAQPLRRKQSIRLTITLILLCFRDDDDDITPTYFISIEQELVVEYSTLKKALLCLLAVHYVFDLNYNDRVKDFFLFLQEKVMKIADGSYAGGKISKKSASYLSTTSAIECYKSQSD